MKIAVYAIAKNEEKFAGRWVASARDADYLCVTDTGSTDQTISLLKNLGVRVQEKIIEPWRFDTARNESLAFVPEDANVCISLDMDEVLAPGWRAALLKDWTPETTLLRYPFVSAWEEDGVIPKTVSYGFKIHARHGYRWDYAIHELLRPLGRHTESTSERLRIYHYSDPTKNRGLYRSMLESLVVGEPNEGRYHMYLGRDYFDHGDYESAIRETERYLDCMPIRDRGERAFAYRVLAWSHGYLGRSVDLVIQNLLRAVAESPEEREPWFHLAEEMAKIGNWPNSFSATVSALKNRDVSRSYMINPVAWGSRIEELFMLSGSRLGLLREQLEFMRKNYF